MPYPRLEQYQEALQHPKTAFIDPTLRGGRIRTTGLGLPVVVSGGFALTYTVEVGRLKYAVRCFHREAQKIQARYSAISKKLKSLKSNYFVDFEFQPHGIRIAGAPYPIVKMQWAQGETLGEFISNNYNDKQKMTNLTASLVALSQFLSQNQIAHGDIQEGNLIIDDDGRNVVLIDYDGMFVPEIASLGASEVGHRDFQHPGRDSKIFDESLDRFAFIELYLALRALRVDSSLWAASSSGAGVILFRANDLADPRKSTIIGTLLSYGEVSQFAHNFIEICRTNYLNIPTLDNFIAGNVGHISVAHALAQVTSPERQAYISQYPVLNASDYIAFTAHVGQIAELVGKVVEVTNGTTRHGKPYVFINFGPWEGKCVKITLWSDALDRGGERPSRSWIGRWVTVRGLVEPRYTNRRLTVRAHLDNSSFDNDDHGAL